MSVRKIIVGLKRVIDYNVRVRVRPDGSGVETDGVKMSINPFDEIALEEALRIKEQGKADEIIVLSIGASESQQQLRTGLAIATDDVHNDIEPLAVAKLLKAVVDEEQPSLILCGKQAIDNDMNATGQMLSALLGWSQATYRNSILAQMPVVLKLVVK